jgi:6-phosphofructokinase 1
VVKASGGEIFYKPTAEVIKQRHVDLAEVALYERLGICFGRKPEDYEPQLKALEGKIERYM